MIFDEQSLEERKYTAIRKKSAIIATSRPYTIAMIVLTIAYSFQVFIYLAIEEFIEGDQAAEATMQVIELVLLTTFVIDILINIIAFRRRYFQDKMAIADIVVILFTILFVILDLVIDS